MKTKNKFENKEQKTMNRNETSNFISCLSTINPYILSLVISSLFISYLAGCEDEVITRTVTKEVEVEVPVEVPVKGPPVEVPVDVPIDFTIGKTPVSSAEEFVKIGTDADYPLSGDYYLTQDIDLSELENYEEGITIGANGTSKPFTGSFYGNGKTIKNFKLKDAATYTGLFGYLYGAQIQNLTIESINSLDELLGNTAIVRVGVLTAFAQCSKIENITIKSAAGVTNPGIYFKRTSGSGPFYLGGIAGYITDSQIINSKSEIKLKLELTVSSQIIDIGGIAGGSALKSKISFCTAAANIEAINTTGRINAGGITGFLSGSAKIENCKTYVNKISAASSGTVIYAGGIAAYGITIHNCTVELEGENPEIKAVSSAASGDFICAAGISGYVSVNVKNCYVSGSGKITAETQSSAVAAGGILAYGNSINTGTPEVGIISNCRTGQDIIIEAKKTSSSASTKFTSAGGIIGYSNNAAEWSIENCYSLSKISLVNAADTSGSLIYNFPSAGGLLGSGAISPVKHSYFGGTVTVTNTNSDTTVFAGGLAGYSGGQIDASFVYNKADNLPTINVITNGALTFTANGVDYTSVHRINGNGAVTGFANWAKGGNWLKTGASQGDLAPVSTANNASGPDGDNIADIPGGLSRDFLEYEIGGGGEDYVWDFTNVWTWDSALGLPVLR